jgi:poly-gamma-glutamate capsule biosynthesis protein CapA/YwtB (metallophosphatase superfamily)
VNDTMTLFLAGDVMPGRGIDQALLHSVDPMLFEPAVKDARRYLELAEQRSGPIERPLSYEQVWGVALRELERVSPDARVINLEVALTASRDWNRHKGIHYRSHPANVALLRAARIDACVIANNHVLDWGVAGLLETLRVLDDAGVRAAGAGRDRSAARAPAVLRSSAGRLLVFSYALPSAGVPRAWAAASSQPGVNLLEDVSDAQAERVVGAVRAWRREGDRAIVSLHWGPNWGYAVPAAHRRFARRLVDEEAADVVFGHSSHHPLGIEVYRGRLILYGAGDLLNDYEGIGGREAFRPELALMYFPALEPDGLLASLELAPVRVRRLRLERPGREETSWLAERSTRHGAAFGTAVEVTEAGRLRLRWR